MKSNQSGRTQGARGKTQKKSFRARRWFQGLLIAGGIIVLVIILMFVAVSKWPALAANGADALRNIIGDQAVAQLEMVLFRVQDTLQMWKYQLGLVDPARDWPALSSATPTLIPPQETDTPTATWPAATPLITLTAQPTLTPTPTPWQPITAKPVGSAEGEGIWLPYIQDAQGRTVAYQTFVQPDPGRPYTRVAVVAIDLTHTRLHYVLGIYEPAPPDTPARPGRIPKADKVADVLLAAFNGGFKARHGQFGAMADGITALPPRDGLGTLAVYDNGEVRLGEWGVDLSTPTGMDLATLHGMTAFRQNGPLVIQKGAINPRIYNNLPADWGYTVTDVSPTIRSGVGLSRDGKTLYYFCGASLSMEALAIAMQAAGAYNAIQLDINNYWVLFTKITPGTSGLAAEPLIPRWMIADVDRYLRQSSRDFFYVTSLPGE